MSAVSRPPTDVGAERHVEASYSSFGDRVTVPLTPLYQALFSDGINARQWLTTVTGTGAVTTVDSKLDVQGAAGDTALVEGPMVKYRPGTALISRFTGVWPNFATKSGESYVGLARGEEDGLLFGMDGGTPTILYRNAGVDTKITSFNGSPALAAKIRPDTGVVFQVSIPYLGFANLALSIYDPAIGEFVRLHTIYRANLYEYTTFSSPSFYWRAQVLGDGHVQSGSVMVGIQGPSRAGDLHWGDTLTATLAAGTHYAYALQNASATSLIKLSSLQIGVDGTKPVSFRILDTRAGVTGGAWTSVHADSVAEKNTTATAVTPAWPAFSGALGKAESRSIPLREYELVVAPTHQIAIELVLTATTDVVVSLGWWEDP